MDRQYWFLLHRSMTDQHLLGFERVIHGSIVELSLDGTVTIWPASAQQAPEFSELCEICERYLSSDNIPGSPIFRAGCVTDRLPGQICCFQPAPEAEECQDLESLLIDGSCLARDGTYIGLSHFLQAHDIAPGTFITFSLGIHPSIRTCRQWLQENETLY